MVIPIPGDSIKILLNTFRAVFPHASLWCIHGSTQCMMLATPERLAIDYQELTSRLEPVLEPSGLADFGVESVDKFLSFLLLGEEGLDRALEGHTTLNTDDLPHAQFRIKDDVEGTQASLDLVEHQESIRPYLVNLGPQQEAIEHRLETYRRLSQRLNWGFLLNSSIQHRIAGEIANRAGLSDDQNVATSLKYDRKLQEAFESRIDSHPEDANAHNTLGYIYWQQGKLARAAETLGTAVRLKSDFALAHSNLARVLIDAGRYDEATERLLEMQRIHPTQRTLSTVRTRLGIVRTLRKLRRLGWSVLVVWECQTTPARRDAMEARVARFLARPT